jgi:hypothetical protein
LADIKRFNGYTAVDGSYHANKTAALAHSNEIKVRTALNDVADSMIEKEPELGHTYLKDHLFTHRTELLKALQQTAVLKAPARKKVKKSADTPSTPADF